MNAQQKSENQISRHSATDPEKCYLIAKKYGWKLLRIEPTQDPVLKVDCIFEGDTEFPADHKEE